MTKKFAPTFWTAAAVLALAAPFVRAQDKQPVPDAPVPQSTQTTVLPKLNTITPVAPAVAEPPAPTPQATKAADDAAAKDNGGVVPTGSLNNVPQTGQPAFGQVHDDDGAPPDLNADPKTLPTIKVFSQFVEVPFTVKDSKGKPVAGITWRDVRIYENGERQQLRFFTTDAYPLSVALVIDQSLESNTMEKINASLHALQGAFTPYDEVAVFTYNNGVSKQTTFTAAQSNRLGVILERSKSKGREPVGYMGGPLEQTNIKNNQIVDPNTTASRGQVGITVTQPKEYHTLNDAILAAAEETSRVGRGRRRIVYVISDGKEYGSKATQKEVIRYLQANKVEVYATLVGDSAVPGLGFLDRIHLPLQMRDDVLPKYAAATGGQIDPEFRPKGIEQSFQKITEEVRTQYTAGYYTHLSPLDDRFRRIEVRVLVPGLNVTAKDGYYPSADDTNRPKPVAVSSPLP